MNYTAVLITQDQCCALPFLVYFPNLPKRNLWSNAVVKAKHQLLSVITQINTTCVYALRGSCQIKFWERAVCFPRRPDRTSLSSVWNITFLSLELINWYFTSTGGKLHYWHCTKWKLESCSFFFPDFSNFAAQMIKGMTSVQKIKND